MSLNIRDAESAFLYGKAEFDDWMMKFEARWNMPDTLLYMAAVVKDAGMKGMLANPEAVIKTDKFVRKMTGRE